MGQVRDRDDESADGREVVEETVRVAFFSPEPSNLKATWSFCVLPVELGRSHGIEGSVFSAPAPRLHDYIWLLWAKRRLPGRLAWGIYWYFIVLPFRILQVAGLGRFDVVFVQRSMFRMSSRPVFEWIASRIFGKPIVLHIDDALWIRFPRRPIEKRCQLAELVVTGNSETADFITSAGGQVRKVHFGIEVERYSARKHDENRELVIGFTGTGGDVYLNEISDPLSRALEETGSRLAFIGGPGPPDLPALERHLDWLPWNDDAPTAFLETFDVAICPLIDDEWTRGKETFKIKEYMAAGLPQVLSPVGYGLEVIEDGVEGFFAETPDEWFERLIRLIGDPDLRNEMGRAARMRIETEFNVNQMIAGTAAVCREAAGKKGA
ncbi:MAG: glycosyltransferase family 4 protein [Solirubrobacterales bacterium]